MNPSIEEDNSTPMETYISGSRYSQYKFQGFLPDSGAAGKSSAGEAQVKALQQHMNLHIDTTGAGESISFGVTPAEIKGTVVVDTLLGKIIFHVVSTNTPFLICLKDMDRLGVYFDNINNLLIQKHGTKLNCVPVVRKWGHPFMLLNSQETISCFLTERELRQIHRRWGHPSIQRFATTLDAAGQEFEHQILKKIAKHCEQCQLHDQAPRRFKISLTDEYEFNYSIIVDVMYLDGSPVLHIVDSATGYGAGGFLNNMTAKHVWDMVRYHWVDTYLGPPDVIVVDAGTNLNSKEFKQHAGSMAADVKVVPVESHHSIGKVERYHAPLRRIYTILKEQLHGEGVDKHMILRMAFKAINDTAGPGGIVPTLLVYGAYPRLTNLDAPSLSVTKRRDALRVATAELRKHVAERKVADALHMRNGPKTLETLNLPLQSDVRVYREDKEHPGRGKWTGPYKLISRENETCRVLVNNKISEFRSTSVKPWYAEDMEHAGNQENMDPQLSDHERALNNARNVVDKSGSDVGGIFLMMETLV